MSARDQTIRFNFKVASELPSVKDQLESINQLLKQQGKIAQSTADVVKAVAVQSKNDQKLAAEESLAISKEILRQMTLDKKAAFEQQTSAV